MEILKEKKESVDLYSNVECDKMEEEIEKKKKIDVEMDKE